MGEETDLKKCALDLLQKGVKVWHGKLIATGGAPSALVTPPGWVLAYRNQECKAWGVKKAFLAKGANNIANLRVAAAFDTMASNFHDLLSVVT